MRRHGENEGKITIAPDGEVSINTEVRRDVIIRCGDTVDATVRFLPGGTIEVESRGTTEVVADNGERTFDEQAGLVKDGVGDFEERRGAIDRAAPRTVLTAGIRRMLRMGGRA